MGTDEHGLGTEFLIRLQGEPELFCKRHGGGIEIPRRWNWNLYCAAFDSVAAVSFAVEKLCVMSAIAPHSEGTQSQWQQQ